MRVCLVLFIAVFFTACASSYEYYEQPKEPPLVRLEVDDQVDPKAFMKQKSEGFVQGLTKMINVANSFTLWGINAGILSVNGQYLESPKVAYRNAVIYPGENEIRVAAFLSGGEAYYDAVSYNFEAGKSYIVRIGVDGPDSIFAEIHEK